MIFPTIKTLASQVVHSNRNFLKVLILAIAVPNGAIIANHFQPVQQIAVEQQQRRLEINQEDLPAAIQQDLLTNYGNAAFVEAMKYLDEEGNVLEYEVRLAREQTQNRHIKLVYDPEGKQKKDKDKKRPSDKPAR